VQADRQPHNVELGSWLIVARQLDHCRRCVHASRRKARGAQLARQQAAATADIQDAGAGREPTFAQ